MTKIYEHEKSNLEHFILKLMLENISFLSKYYTKLGSDVFSKPFVPVVTCILDFYKKKKMIPPRTVLTGLYFPKVIENDDIRSQSVELIDFCYGMKDMPIDKMQIALKEDIDKFLHERILISKMLHAYAELTQGKGKDTAIAILKEAMQIDFSDSLGLDYFQDLQSRGDRIKSNTDIVYSTGLPTLDELLGGGYRKKALFVFAGPANSGKSLILNDAAVNLAIQKKNVLYLCLELSEDYVAQRTDAKFGGIEMNKLNADPVDGIQKALAKYQALKESGSDVGVLWYKEYAPGAASCLDIVALMKSIEAKKNIKFDFIIVDYLRLLNAAGKVFGDNMYAKLTTICEEVRKMAMEENVCVLSASQTNRESYNSSSPGMETLSDSIGIAQTADALVTLGRDASLNKEDLMLLSVVKSRFSKNGNSLVVRVSYDYMKLIDMGNRKSYGQESKEKKMSEVKESFKTKTAPRSDPKPTNDFDEIVSMSLI